MMGVPLAELVDEIVPHTAEHAVPPCVSVQLTPLLAGSLVTVAVNCCVRFTGRSRAPAGAIDTAMGGTVTVAAADAEGLETEVAVMVTVKLLAGGVVGAVYVVAAPLAVPVGKTEPHGVGEHDTVQLTPLFAGSLLTVAVNCAVAAACTDAEFGVTTTETPGIVMVTEPDTVGSLTEAAVTVTCKSLNG
jgi:hypothetical protein